MNMIQNLKNAGFQISLFFIALCTHGYAQVKTVTSDKNWDAQLSELTNAYEAEYIIRIGDVDNLGFGWPEGFDPFCGRMTEAHSYPWEKDPKDPSFFDQILISSKYNPEKDHPCGSDGYSWSTDLYRKGPALYSIPTATLKKATIRDAWLQLFIDDFQSPTFCSKFRVKLNDKIFTEGEKIINAIDQTGPVGKLITLPIPEEFFEALGSGLPLRIEIDELNGAGDGYAIDFIRLMVNRIRENSCKGNIRGYVLDKETGEPLKKASVTVSGNIRTLTNNEGMFSLMDIPTGFEILTATSTGYADGNAGTDIGEGDINDEIYIYLERGIQKISYGNTPIQIGESIVLNNILFDQGKATLRPESYAELQKVIQLMLENPKAEIELSGHTSSEGDRKLNQSLSYKRVNACKDYIVSQSIDAGRITAVGYGPDRPVAPNDNEANRSKNRRVELRVIKI